MAASPFSIMAEHELARFTAAAQEFADSGRVPATPRLAATVALMRPDGAVFLMRRSMGMVFGGRWAFPGGSADMLDAEAPGACFDPDTESATARRAAVREVAEETGLDLDPAKLIPWSRWVTPLFEPRRFDTYFFVGPLTTATELDVVNGEADATGWFDPADAVARFGTGEMPMLPPTVITLQELAQVGTPAGILAAAAGRSPRSPILPALP